MNIDSIKKCYDMFHEPIQTHWKFAATVVSIALVVNQIFGKMAFMLYSGAVIFACTKYPQIIKKISEDFNVQGISLAIMAAGIPFFGFFPGIAAACFTSTALCVQEWRLYKLRVNCETELTKLKNVEKKLEGHRLERERLSLESHQKMEEAAAFWEKTNRDDPALEQQEKHFTEKCAQLKEKMGMLTKVLTKVESPEWTTKQLTTLQGLQGILSEHTDTMKETKSSLNQKITEMENALRDITEATAKINTRR